MSGSSDKSVVYAAGEGREWLRGELEEKPNDWVREFAGMVNDADTLDLLNYYCSLWEDDPQAGDFLDTVLAERILSSAATRSMDTAFREGRTSQLKGFVGMTGQRKETAGDWMSAVVDRLEHEGAIGLVLGPPGAGKTAMTLDVARTWAARTGGALIGNTSWEGFDRVVHSDQELLEAMAEIEGAVLAVIDETAQELSGFGSGNKDAETFSDSLTFVRKKEEKHGPYAKRGSVLMVNHTRTKTAKPFRDLCSFAIEKPHRSKPNFARILESEGGQDRFEEGLETDKLTDTRETYAEHEASEFEILGDRDDDEEDDTDGRGLSEREQAIQTALRAVKPWDDEDGVRYKDAAEIVGYSKGWVTNRVSDWRDGDYSTLVTEQPE
ncbi:hypothetical protein [Salarchaeum sp. JOR-1]|uniref:hypothetical protein n=1 Tax=Salarchaeum sp. JOR-1 TaxID=2599399 RepID=UPI00119877C7|nr:hypothetical protein [Salarchaeum sp. JOR-1]QDX39850.1 hypothetical protein FQU85_02650 [Salarchaeum sp. JOR-1]